MKKIELLAPAGDLNCLKAAIQAGADAVYIGGYGYSARAYANNFSNEEIIEAVNYAHPYGVKIFVAVNTLIYENEVETFLNYIDFLHRNSVDALIIQDLGMVDLIRKTYPNLELHASTQMHIHNIEGVKFLSDLGVKRVVLARETPIETIKDITTNTNTDIEVFSHGALCVCYSGQCLMSSLIGGRSANRGSCVGCCRLEYDLVDENNKKYNTNKYLLSMKDLCTIEHVPELIEAGITSIKIEGRMKRIEYIYEVISIYRKAIDNYYKYGKTNITEEDIKRLYKIYNRKFTKGFLFNEKNENIVNQIRPNHQGIKIGTVIKKENNYIYIKLTDKVHRLDGIRILNKKEDVGTTIEKMFVNNKPVEEANNQIIKIKMESNVDINDVVVKTTDIEQINNIKEKLKNQRKVEIKINATLKINNPIILEIEDEEHKIKLESNYIIEQAKTIETTKENIEQQLKKLGNTIYNCSKINIEKDNNIFVSIKELNELRRKAIEQLNDLRNYKIEYKKEEYNIDVPDFEHAELVNYLYDNEKEIKEEGYNIYLIKSNNQYITRVPRVNDKYKDYTNKLLVGEIGSLNYYKGKKLFTDFSFNVVNSYTVAFLHSIGIWQITLSYELELDQIKELIDNYHKRYKKHPNLEVIIYGREEMMITKFNLLKNLEKNKKYYLQDKYKNKFILKEENGLMTIYNFKCRDNQKLINDYYKIGINNIRFNLNLQEEIDDLYH